MPCLLLAAAGAVWFGVISSVAVSAVEPLHTGNFLAATQCDISPAELGLESQGTFPFDASQEPALAGLSALVVRMEPSDQKREMLAAGATRLSYRDFVHVFHQASPGVDSALNEAIADLQDQGRIESMWRCRFIERPGQITLYKPFFAIEDDVAHVTADVLVFSRPVTVAVNSVAFTRVENTTDALADLITSLDEPPADLPSVPAIGEDPLLASLPQDEPPAPAAEEEPAPAVIRNYYAWVVALDFAAAAPGEKVFVPDRVDCRKNSNFIVGSIGRIAAPEQHEASGPEVAAVIRDEMIAANLYFGASGNPTDEKTVAASVDDTSYWCIPKRETCFQRVDFGDFQVRVRAGDIDEFPRHNVISLRHGLANALERVVMDSCPQQAIAKGT